MGIIDACCLLSGILAFWQAVSWQSDNPFQAAVTVSSFGRYVARFSICFFRPHDPLLRVKGHFALQKRKEKIMATFRTYELSLKLHEACRSMKMGGAYRDQFERALLSVSLNLSEGSAKPTARDRRKFYYIALGSLREVQTLLKIRGSVEHQILADQLGAHLYQLCKRT